jgi:hypothetical protein
MSILIKLTRYVRSALLTNIEKIICIMLTIDNKYWLDWFGKDYYEKIADAFKCSNQQKNRRTWYTRLFYRPLRL